MKKTDGRKYPWGNELVNCDYAVTDVDELICAVSEYSYLNTVFIVLKMMSGLWCPL